MNVRGQIVAQGLSLIWRLTLEGQVIKKENTNTSSQNNPVPFYKYTTVKHQLN